MPYISRKRSNLLHQLLTAQDGTGQVEFALEALKAETAAHKNERPMEGEIADEIAELLNTLCLDMPAIADALAAQHRTLQQTFTGLCLAWLQKAASHDYRFDARNEAAHNVALQIVDLCEINGVNLGRLPTI